MAIPSVSLLKYSGAINKATISTSADDVLVNRSFIYNLLGASTYDGTQSYSAGDLVVYTNGDLYRASENISANGIAPGATGTKWVSASIKDAITTAATAVSVSSGPGVTISNQGVASLNLDSDSGLSYGTGDNANKVKVGQGTGISVSDGKVSVDLTRTAPISGSGATISLNYGSGLTTANESNVTKLVVNPGVGLGYDTGTPVGIKVKAYGNNITANTNGVSASIPTYTSSTTYYNGDVVVDESNYVLYRFIYNTPTKGSAITDELSNTIYWKKLSADATSLGLKELAYLDKIDVSNTYTKIISTSASNTSGSETGRYSQTTVETGDIVVELTSTDGGTTITKTQTWMYVGKSSNTPKTDANWIELKTSSAYVAAGTYASTATVTGTPASISVTSGGTRGIASFDSRSFSVTSGYTSTNEGKNGVVTLKPAGSSTIGGIMVSNGGGITYNSTTGAFSLTSAGNNQVGVVSLAVSSGVMDSNELTNAWKIGTGGAASDTIAATPKAVVTYTEKVLGGYQAKLSGGSDDNNKVLAWDNTSSTYKWVNQTTDTTYSAATSGALGLVKIPAESTSYLNNDSGTIKVAVKTNGGIAYDSAANATGLYVSVDDSTIEVNQSGLLQVKSGVYTTAITQHSTSSTYAKGQIVYADGVLYKAENAIGTGTAIGHTNWTALTFKCGAGLAFDTVNRNSGSGTYYGTTIKVDSAVSNTISTVDGTTTYSAAGKIPKLTSNGTLSTTLLPSGGTSGKGIVQLTNIVGARSSDTSNAVTPKGVADYAVANVPYLNWASGVVYAANALVYYDGSIYQCKTQHTSAASGDKGAPVSAGNTYWRPYSKYTGEHSGPTTGTSTYIEIPHSLNTQDIVVQVYKIESDGKHPVLVDFTFGTTSGTQSDTIKDNNITLQFATGQSNSDTYRVVILAAR